MSKSNKILLGVFAFVVVCVMGYALFSETITVTGSATAKGEFNISTTCKTGVTEEILTAYGVTNDIFKEGGYEKDYCNLTTTGVEFGTNFLYPTAKRDFTVIIKNDGTIAAQAIMFLEEDDGDIKISGKACNGDNYPNECHEINRDYFDLEDTGETVVLFIKKDGSHVLMETPEYSNFYDSDTGIMTLEPGESAMMVFYARWPEDANLNHMINTYNVEIDFKQVQ